MIELVTTLGGEAVVNGDLLTIRGSVTGSEIDPELSGLIHGSTYMIPAVLAQTGRVTFGALGGDGFGNYEFGMARPIGQVIEVLEEFGATFARRGSLLELRGALKPADVDILRWSENRFAPAGPRVSSATKTALLVAAATPGRSVIRNPHDKAAEHDLISMLRLLGVNVEQRGTTWFIDGVTPSSGRCARVELTADPTEVLTWQAIAAVTKSNLTVAVSDADRVRAAVELELNVVRSMTATTSFGEEAIHFGPPTDEFAGQHVTASSTGLSTDILPLLAVQLLSAETQSQLRDEVWRNRFGYVEGLRSMGANISHSGRGILLQKSHIRPAAHTIHGTDTRSAAALLVACLGSEGTHTIHGLQHLDRGYASLLDRLRKIGASVEIVGLPSTVGCALTTDSVEHGDRLLDR